MSITHYTSERLEDVTIICVDENNINPSPPSAAYIRKWNGSALVKITAYRLFGRHQAIV